MGCEIGIYLVLILLFKKFVEILFHLFWIFNFTYNFLYRHLQAFFISLNILSIVVLDFVFNNSNIWSLYIPVSVVCCFCWLSFTRVPFPCLLLYHLLCMEYCVCKIFVEIVWDLWWRCLLPEDLYLLLSNTWGHCQTMAVLNHFK